MFEPLRNFENGDIIIPYSIITDKKYKNKIMFAGSEYSLNVWNIGGENNVSPLRFNPQRGALSASQLFLLETSHMDLCLFTKIGEVVDLGFSSHPRFGCKTYFYIYNSEIYKLFSIAGKHFIYRIDSKFPFIHIHKRNGI